MYMYTIRNIAEQKSYGSKNFYKLETAPHENQNPIIQDDFLKIEYKSNYKAQIGAKFEVFHNLCLDGFIKVFSIYNQCLHLLKK